MRKLLAVTLFCSNSEQGEALRDFLIKNKSIFMDKTIFDKWEYELDKAEPVTQNTTYPTIVTDAIIDNLLYSLGPIKEEVNS